MARRGPRRRTLWATTFANNVIVASGAHLVPVNCVGSLITQGVGIIGGTVIRTHVNLNILNLDTDTAPEVQWALLVYDTNKVAAATPNITTELNLDYAMYEMLTPGTSSGNIARPENAPTFGVYGREYDVKSRRRLHEMQDGFFFCLINQGTQSLTLNYLIRCLIMLP